MEISNEALEAHIKRLTEMESNATDLEWKALVVSSVVGVREEVTGLKEALVDFKQSTVDLFKKVGEHNTEKSEAIKEFFEKNDKWVGTVDATIESLNTRLSAMENQKLKETTVEFMESKVKWMEAIESRLSLMEEQVDEMEKSVDDNTYNTTLTIMALGSDVFDELKKRLDENTMSPEQPTIENARKMVQGIPTLSHVIRFLNEHENKMEALAHNHIIFLMALGKRVYEDFSLKMAEAGVSNKTSVDEVLKLMDRNPTLSSVTDRLDVIEAKINQ